MCEDERATAVKQYEVTQEENRQLSDKHRKEMTSATLTIDDFKMKVTKFPLSDSMIVLLIAAQE